MNAQAIHDLYSGLWKRVPETRPKHLEFETRPDPGSVPSPSGNLLYQWSYYPVPGNAAMMWPINNEDAARICRSAVLEWLLNRGQGSVVKFIRGDENHVGIITTKIVKDGWEADFNTAGRCESLDHALVATAMRVAEKP